MHWKLSVKIYFRTFPLTLDHILYGDEDEIAGSNIPQAQLIVINIITYNVKTQSLNLIHYLIIYNSKGNGKALSIYAVKSCKEARGMLHLFLNLALDGGEWLLHVSATLL
jgi:hypothetical protein